MSAPSFLKNPRGAAASVLVLAGAGAGIAIWALQSPQAAQEALPTTKASKGSVVVSVGGVGRIVQQGAKADGQANGVYPRTSGRIQKVLVETGQTIERGQTLAIIDDGGVAAAAITQARQELEIAQVELRQKQTSDPLNGAPPTAAEIAAATQALASARTRLNRLYAPPTRAERAAADAEVVRAEADLAALQQRAPATPPEAIAAAKSAVAAAKQKLALLKGPRDQVAIANARAELTRAEADLALLEKAPQAPLPEEIYAAQRTIVTWQEKLTLYKASGDTIAAVDAQLELDRAYAALAQLQRVQPGPLPAEIAAARSAVDRARANLKKAQSPATAAEITTAQLELDRAVADLVLLQRPQVRPTAQAISSARKALQLAKVKRAFLGRPNPQDIAAARADLKRAEADLALLRSRGGPARSSDIQLAQLRAKAAAARVSAATAALKKLRVISPFGGTVTSMFAVPGIPVDGTTPIATVADLEVLEAVVDLSEFDVAQVRKGQRAEVGIDALGGEAVLGKVTSTALTGTSSSGGIVTFPVRVSLTDTEGLKPGMNVSVKIIVAAKKNVIQVPLDAVQTDDEDRSTVTVVTKSGETATRVVKLGLVSNNNAEVLKGLKPGDQVMVIEEAAAGEEE